jgi:hypothetical protein
MITLKQVNSVMAVIGTAATTFEIMMKTFKWYEKLHGKKKSKKEKNQEISRPIIKGL